MTSRRPDVPDLWPEDFGETEVIPPVSILKAQAALLSKRTKGLLNGRIESNARRDAFYHSLIIVAPALGDYQYSLLMLRHGIELYPCAVSATWEQNWHEADSQDGLVELLRGVLSDARTVKVLRALIAQSKAGDALPIDDLPF